VTLLGRPVLPRTRRGRAIVGGVLVLLALAAGIGYTAWYKLYRTEDQQIASIEERWKHGSIGNEGAEGIPYYIWAVLPDVFGDLLPNHGRGGWASLGFLQEPGRELPVGWSKKRVGFDRVAFTCAACHTGSYRTAADAERRIVPTAPSTRLDFQGFARFLVNTGRDPRYTTDTIMAAIEKRFDLGWFDRQLYRYVIVPQTRRAQRNYYERLRWMDARPDWGPGRIDPFNPVKFHQLGIDQDKDHSIGNSDMEPLWNMAPKANYSLHWDGLNDNLTEVVLTGAIGDGATTVSGEADKDLPVGDLGRIEEYIRNVKAPRYPFRVDDALAARGERVFRDTCATCHEFGGARTGTVIPLPEIRTDRHRIDMWSQTAADRYNDYANGFNFDFKRFVKRNGYVAVPLDGVWMRAPYLHNGSVPTLEDLLKPARDRPKAFFRGYDVYDRERTGFVHTGPAAQREGWRYDTRIPANSNRGHEGARYGTTLPERDKRALVEYLKTR
jgi:hypothetical protein